MRAGELKDLIGIYYSNNTVNAFGEKTSAPLTLYKEVRAAIIYKVGRETEDNMQVTPSVILQANIRYDETFDESYSVYYKNEFYNITGITHKNKSLTTLYLIKAKLWGIQPPVIEGD